MIVAEPAWLIAGGVALVAALAWFGPAARRPKKERSPSGPPEAILVLDERDTPEILVAPAGGALKLRVLRADASRATEEIAIPPLGIVRTVPANRTTTIDLDLPSPGSYPIRDRNGAIRGILVAEPQS